MKEMDGALYASGPMPKSPISSALSAIESMVAVKSSDYARGSVDPFVNFKETATITGSTPLKVALTQVGIKMSRISHLEADSSYVNNESLYDSYLDLACYAVLALAMKVSLSEEE